MRLQITLTAFTKHLMIAVPPPYQSNQHDQIDHSFLLQKVQFGFSDNLVSLLKSYLVECESFRSDMFIPTSGYFWGSNLGPLLFSLFINDLTTLNCSTLAYDIKIFALL